MSLLKKIKYFIVSVDYLISRSFFFSNSKFSNLIKDFLYSTLNGLSNNNLKIVSGYCDLNTENFLEPKNNRSLFSKNLTLEKIPKSIFWIVNKHKNEINNIIGKNFVYDDLQIYENYNFDEKFEIFDVYSNIWHLDSHVGNRLVTIFVLLDDCDINGGPFIYLSEKDTKKNWEMIKDRYTFDKKNSNFPYDNQIKFIGKKGSYLILNTSKAAHRASIPESKRKILAISLYPSWQDKKNHNIKRKKFN